VLVNANTNEMVKEVSHWDVVTFDDYGITNWNLRAVVSDSTAAVAFYITGVMASHDATTPIFSLCLDSGGDYNLCNKHVNFGTCWFTAQSYSKWGRGYDRLSISITIQQSVSGEQTLTFPALSEFIGGREPTHREQCVLAAHESSRKDRRGTRTRNKECGG
jgi:hypothetical protein